MKTTMTIMSLLGVLIFTSCSKEDDSTTIPPVVQEIPKSGEKKITSFAFKTTNNAALTESITATINENDKTITAIVPFGTDITAFTPEIVASSKASVSPTGAQDFSTPVAYTITAEDNTKTTYTTTITPAPNTEKAIVSFQFLLSENPFEVNVIADIDEDKKLITFDVPDGADITALLPSIQISENASISPEGLQNFEESVTYIVTAQDGSTTSYEVKAIHSQRAILLAIYIASPDNTLGWDIESSDIGTWQGVTTDPDGNVTKLYLGDGNIRNVSPKIGLLTHLTSLRIGKSHFTELPIEIGNLINLTHLNIDLSKITRLPEEIGNLTNLTHLSIKESNLNELPAEIGNLNNLKFLFLSNNQLNQIPSEIGNLTNLTDLSFTNNPLIQLPPQIGNLSSLFNLSLNNMQLTEIPPEIGNLTSLLTLVLARNNLQQIPIEIGNLTNLTYLDLSQNQLTHIPAEIGNLVNLTSLNLLQNQLPVIPVAVCNLQPDTVIEIEKPVKCAF